MLDAQQAAKRMALAFYELTLAREPVDACTQERFKAAQRRVTVLARIFLSLRDNAKFEAAYACEMAALRGQAVNPGSGPHRRLSSSPR